MEIKFVIELTIKNIFIKLNLLILTIELVINNLR